MNKFGKCIGVLVLLSGCGVGDTISILDQFDPTAGFKALFDNNPFCVVESTWDVSGVTKAGAEKHDDTVIITREKHLAIGPVLGLEDPISSSSLAAIEFEIGDLGDAGSVMLDAQVIGYSDDREGWVYPILVKFEGPSPLGTFDYINLNSNCFSDGIFVCDGLCGSTGSSCDVNPLSVYMNRTHWQQNNIAPFSFHSTSVFPTCNWTSGDPICQFNSNGLALFDESGPGGPRLRSGTYRATYVLLASSYASLPDGSSAQLEVTVAKKRDLFLNGSPNPDDSAAVDLNVIFVGSENVSDSESAAGQANLNALLDGVISYFEVSSTKVKIGKITAYNLGCDSSDGEVFADVDISELGTLFLFASDAVKKADPDSEGKSINLLFVSSITATGFGSSIILGAAGAIGGPGTYTNGASGVAVRTDDEIDSLSTTSGTFKNLIVTIAHEIGHYLGLNHASEKKTVSHDPVPDTPQCGDIETVNDLTTGTCLDSSKSSTFNAANMALFGSGECSALCAGYNGSSVFCSSVTECQFNHLMWFTTKNFSSTDGDASVISDQSGVLINYHGLVQ